MFEAEARRRLRGRDEEDWPVLAAALSLSCAIWTEDTDFFGTGVAVWTSDRVEIFLKEQSEQADLESSDSAPSSRGYCCRSDNSQYSLRILRVQAEAA